MTAPQTLEQQYVEACIHGNYALRARLEHELDAAGRADDARLTAPDALRKAALWYAKQGVAVFPCQPHGKQPAVTNGFKDATTDLDQVNKWWTRLPQANIGAPTGIRFDVIDIDGPLGVGATYFDPEVTMPPEIGHSMTSRQAGHHVFIEPTGDGNRASFLPGVDYRGKGGYVILPPSIVVSEHTPPEGTRYVWTRPLVLA